MADIQYINYGDQQIDQQALLERMADQVDKYVDKQRWSKSRKNKFKQAYSDLISRGIIGAQIETSDSKRAGKWVIRINGDDFNEDNLPRKDKEMYQAAAWFIKDQMSYLAQNKKVEPVDDKKEEKTPFGSFKNGFIKHVANQKFGGEKFTTDQWNNFDERDASGIRGTDNRMKMLSELLQSYSDSISDDKFDFADTPYSNASELKGRIQEAITALGTPDKRDDMEKLYALGLDPTDWFNNGSGDYSGYTDNNGNPLTYAQYHDALQNKKSEEIKRKFEENKKKVEEYNKWYQNVKSFKPEIPKTNNSNNLNYNTAGLVADISSLLGDVVSLSGGPVGVGAGVWSLVSDLAGDVIKGKNIGTILGNVGLNLGWTALSTIPGGKIPKLGKRASQLYSLITTSGIAMDEDIQNTWKKMASGNFDLNNKDIENIKWTMHALTGDINTIRNTRAQKKVDNILNKRDVKTTEGVVTLNESQLRDINRAGRRGGNQVAQQEFQRINKNKNVQLAEGQFNFGEKGLAWYNPKRYSARLAGNKGNLKGVVNQAAVRNLQRQAVQRMHSGWHPFRNSSNPILKNWGIHFNWNSDPSGRRTLGYLRQKGYDLPRFSNIKVIDNSGQINPITTAESPNARQPLSQGEIIQGNSISGVYKKPEINYNRETINRYKDITNNKFSNNSLILGDNKLGKETVSVFQLPDGSYSLLYKGNIVENSYNQKHIQQAVANIIKKQMKTNKDSSDKLSITELGKVLREFKTKGWLKQGGRIDKQKIQKYKEYIKK